MSGLRSDEYSMGRYMIIFQVCSVLKTKVPVSLNRLANTRAYYLIATLLIIKKIIGKIYPVFGIALLFMAVSIAAVMIFKGFSGEMTLMEFTPANAKNWHHIPEQIKFLPVLCYGLVLCTLQKSGVFTGCCLFWLS
jgi:carbon starvation protein CstA